MGIEIQPVRRLTPAQAGKVLGMGAELIRAGLRQGIFPFGVAIEGKTGQYSYLILENKLIKFIEENEQKSKRYKIKKHKKGSENK